MKKIVLWYSCASGVNDMADWGTKNSGLSLPFGACADCYGYLGINSTTFNEAVRVFADGEAEFKKLFDAYQANVKAGRVNVHEARLNVTENKFVGVPGGWSVDVMFVMSAPVRSWEKALPAEMQTELKKARTGACCAVMLSMR